MKLIKYGNYRGFRKGGEKKISRDCRESHILRASYLTAMVESGGKFGCVISYDGTGITAGIHQAIAVYPAQLKKMDGNLRNDQGPLWKLINEVEKYVNAHMHSLWDAIEDIGWYIARDNTVRYLSTGELVSGRDIRAELVGSADGWAPQSGKARVEAEKWIMRFHGVFSDPKSFQAQEMYGIDHFTKRAARAKMRFARNPKHRELTMDKTVYRGTSIDLASFDDEPLFDLALCMYWSHSVNAPGIALKKLSAVIGLLLGAQGSREKFARALVRKLGTSTWGRWSDDIPGGRYQRTRKYAMESGFWDKDLFVGKHAIMPKDL